MGVDYSAVLYIGKQFEDYQEAQEFYERFVNLSEKDQQYIDEEGFQEFCYGLDNGLSGEVLDYYRSSGGFVFGINIASSIRKPESFAEEVQKAINKWKELFGQEKYDIIHTIKIY